MPGLRKSDDYIFVGAFHAIDRAIINPLFMATFFSALVVTGLSAGLHTGADERSILPWIVAALILYFIAAIITIWVHVRRNGAIKAVGSTELMRARDLADGLQAVRGGEMGQLEHCTLHHHLHRRVRLPRLGPGAVRPRLTLARLGSEIGVLPDAVALTSAYRSAHGHHQ